MAEDTMNPEARIAWEEHLALQKALGTKDGNGLDAFVSGGDGREAWWKRGAAWARQHPWLDQEQREELVAIFDHALDDRVHESAGFEGGDIEQVLRTALERFFAYKP